MFIKFDIQKSAPAIAGIFVIIFSVTVFHFYGSSPDSIFKTLDFEITNLMFRLRGEVLPSDKIVIVDIDEKSLRKTGQWPWPRNKIAELIKKIDEKEPKVTGLDMFFPEKDKTSPLLILKDIDIQGLDKKKLLDYDLVLGKQIASSNVAAGYMFNFKQNPGSSSFPISSAVIKIDSDKLKFSDLYINKAKSVILNIPEISVSATEGFLNIFPESSGAVKKVPLFLMYKNIPCPSLALELYRLFSDLQTYVIKPSSQKAGDKYGVLGIYAGKNFIKTDIDAQMYINYRGKPFTYKYISASDILLEKPDINLKGKIVLIGTSAAGLFDLKATPFSGACPGVEIHANVIDNLLNNDFMRFDKYTETGISYLILIIGGLTITILLFFSGPITAGLITVLTISGIFSFNYFFLFKNNTIAGFSFPAASLATGSMTIIILDYFFREKEKKFIQSAFSHYVSPEIVNELIKNPDKLSLSGETKTITIMFGDIRGFTAISEKLQPHELGRLLNVYFSKTSDVIRNNKGVVDKFIGDAVMAFWGAPLESKTHALDSVISAMKIIEELKLLNNQWSKNNFPPVNLGFGINTGEVRIGNFGSSDRFDYTVIGDNVNLASRVEGLNKFYSTNILITEFTNELVKEKILARKTDWVKVKGRTAPVEIYEPLSFFPVSSQLEDETNNFNLALEYYKSGSFTKAEEIIVSLKTKNPLFIYDLYIKRISELKQASLSSWNGVFEFKTK
jgi:adenylate cyclase